MTILRMRNEENGSTSVNAIQEKFLYRSCVVVVLHLCGPLYRKSVLLNLTALSEL